MAITIEENERVCINCKYDGMDRDKCALTEEILVSREIIGFRCPLTIINDVKTEELKK